MSFSRIASLFFFGFFLLFFSACEMTFTVSPSGTNVIINPNTPQTVDYLTPTSFTVTANTGYTLTNTVAGTCPAGSWNENVYTTGAVSQDCTVIFAATNNPVTVTPSGTNVTITPSSAQTIEYNSTQSFNVTADGGYTLSNTVAGTCPAGSWNGATYTTSAITENCTVIFAADAPGTTTLVSSAISLGLSINNPALNPALTGTPRVITIFNLGSETAVNLSILYPTWPAGTSANSTCSSTLVPSASCAITITPGDDATSDCNSGIVPTPGTISVSADNASTITTSVVILAYGCIYQGGYIFSVDDSTPDSGSIGGKVVSQFDQAAQGAIIWSSNGNGGGGADVAYDSIYGISEISTSLSADPSGGQVGGQASCDGATDGSCDSNNINIYYESFASGAPINPSYYAAGLCQANIDGFTDWYLPAICELGYDSNSSPSGSGCGTILAPTSQNIQSNLVNNGNVGGLAPGSGDNYYWSATEWSGDPTNYAWYQLLNLDESGQQFHGYDKNGQTGVRCVRAVTP